MTISREDAKYFVGKGWHSLIDKIYDKLADDDTVQQVKEKWGGLRVYCTADAETLDFISEVEKESFTICETCGDVGKLVKISGWYKTLCEDCLNSWGRKM